MKAANMLNKDAKAKVDRGYVEPDSFVRLDGSEVLVKRDWERRKHELFMRCHGRCEYEGPWKVWPLGAPPMERCWRLMDDAHHIIARWPRRDDRLENLQGICRYHHKLLDKRKPKWSKHEPK